MWRLCLGVAALAAGLAPAAAQPVTFARDVAPIVFARCVGCHRESGDAPFSLLTFDEVRRRAATIRAVTARRYMPPWKPSPGFGEFYGERRLSDVELDVLTRWIDSGMAPGDDRDLPTTPPATDGWPGGVPDLVVELPAYELRADGPDVFRNFVVPIPVASRRHVRGWQFRSRTAAVHHANVRLDPTSASRQLDERDPAPGYEGIILRSADFPEGHFLGWTPGQSLVRFRPEAAWAIEPRSDFIVQLHLRPTGKPETVSPVIGLYFGEAASTARPTMLRLGRQRLLVPAGGRQTVTDSFTLPVDVDALSVLAHAHYRAVSLHAWARLPDESRRELLRIDDWDPAWQDRYEYRSPQRLPAQTVITLEYVFDNTAANPRNPVLPPETAEWGWRTRDEMGDLWLQVTTRSDADRAELTDIVRRKMLNEDAIGSEILIAREPKRVDLRNDAASIYMALDRPADALRHFRVVTETQPSLAQGWFNEGVALEAMGDTTRATQRYREAIRLAPAYAAAHNNLGSLSMRIGNVGAAHESFLRAVASDSSNAEARANLALSYLARKEPDGAVEHVMAAIRLRPDRSGQFVQFAWLLAAAADAGQRRPAAALDVAEALVAATRAQDAGALDALGIARASSGRFEDAVEAARQALSLSPPATLAAGIRVRLDLYLASRPFVLPR